MRQTVREKLNDKSRKMIDLIHDEVCEGGEKTITSSFINQRSHLKYELTVALKVTDPNKEDEECEEPVDTEEPTTSNPETPEGGEDTSNNSVPGEDDDIDLTNPEGVDDSNGL